MKRIFCLIPLFILSCILLSCGAFAAQQPFQLLLYDMNASRYVNQTVTPASISLDGAPLDSDLPPFLYQSRTMAPVRLLAEYFHASVEWVEASRQVHIQTDSQNIVLTIGSPTALVNGQSVLLPDGVSAVMASYQGVYRTMVPLRFVSEYLGAEVGWDSETYTATITSPVQPAEPAFQVTDIRLDDDACSVFLAIQGTPEFLLQDFGDRAVIDLPGGALASGLPASLSASNDLFSAVRYSDHSDLYEGYATTLRVVLDLREGVSCDQVSVTSTDGGLLIQAQPAEKPEEPDDSSDANGDASLPPLTTPVEPASVTIVLDAGHGGSAVGAVYEDIYEKDIKLAVTLKLARLLRDCGYQVVLTRTDDRDVGLYERADIANALPADIFVSLHSNAAPTVPEYTGIYTYHYPGSRRGSLLAQHIQQGVIQSTGAIDRGTRSADFVVLRETDMAAVLVEMGFMTNHGELMQLMEDSYRDRLAHGIAEGIICYLNSQKALEAQQVSAEKQLDTAGEVSEESSLEDGQKNSAGALPDADAAA